VFERCCSSPPRGGKWPVAAGPLTLVLCAALTTAVTTALAPTPAAAQAPAASNKAIYTCVDERGRRLTADRPIPECLSKEQRVLNADGSVKDVRPPSLTPQERAEQDARERKAAQARAAQAEAARRDRHLLQRYPDEAAHQRARETALEGVRKAQTTTRNRLADLERERVPLAAEAETHAGKPLPPRLRGLLDNNEAARAAQLDASAAQTAEVNRINRWYDTDLSRLRRLWAGAAPGSAQADGEPETTQARPARRP
jgi:hypothetical protein